MLLLVVVAVLFMGQAGAFSITQHRPSDPITVKQGGSFTLFCKADGWFEWCTFKRDARVCDYEWKRDVWNITELNCADFANRAVFQGIYNEYQCAVTIKDATPEDSGDWTCEMEEYNRGGSRGFGAQAAQKFTVVVEVPSTTTTTTSTTTTTTSTTSTTTTTPAPPPTTPAVMSNSDEPAYDEAPMPEEKVEDMEDYTEAEAEGSGGNADQRADMGDKEMGDKEEEEEDEDSFLPVGLSIFFILVIISAAAFGLHYKRKLPPSFYSVFTRKWKPVLSHEECPVTEEEEERHHPSIIKNGAKPLDLNVSELGPMGESANINPDLTTVSFIHDEKSVDEHDLKKEQLLEKVEPTVVEQEQEEEKKDEEKDPEGGANETTPLTEPEQKQEEEEETK